MHAVVATACEGVFLGHLLYVGLFDLFLLFILLRLAVIVRDHREAFLPSNAELCVLVAQRFECLARNREVNHLLDG